MWSSSHFHVAKIAFLDAIVRAQFRDYRPVIDYVLPLYRYFPFPSFTKSSYL